MNGYSKIKLVNTSKSRSIDFSDLPSSPDTTKPIENTSPNSTLKTQETKQIKNNITPSDLQDDQFGKGEAFGVKLSRNCSVSSASTYRFRLDKQNTSSSLQSAVKRAFSMRRSSSVSESYCRIHDQSVTLASPLGDDDDADGVEGIDNNAVQTRSMKKKKQRHGSGRILKACKRLFGR